MSTPTTTPTPKKKFRLGRAVGILAVPVALIVGVSIGSSGSEATTTPAAPPDPPAPIIKTETVTVEKTPDACIKAMDLADQSNDYASEGFGYAGDALTAAGSFDLDGLEKANQEMTDLKPKLQGNLLEYAAASAQCRNAGK